MNEIKISRRKFNLPKLSERYSGKQEIVLNLKQKGDLGIVGPMAALNQRDRTERIILFLLTLNYRS